MDKSIKKIREAVCTNRGGLEEATDEQIMIIWSSLPADVQKQYLESIPAPASSDASRGGGKERKGKDATAA